MIGFDEKKIVVLWLGMETSFIQTPFFADQIGKVHCTAEWKLIFLEDHYRKKGKRKEGGLWI